MIKFNDKGKKKKGGDLNPAPRKVTFKSQAEKDDISLLNRTNSGDLKGLGLKSNQEAVESKSPKNKTTGSVATYQDGGTVKKSKAESDYEATKALDKNKDWARSKYTESLTQAVKDNDTFKKILGPGKYNPSVHRYEPGTTPKGGAKTIDGITEYSNGRAYRSSDGAKGKIVKQGITNIYKGKDENGKELTHDGSEYQWDSYDEKAVKKVKKFVEGSKKINAQGNDEEIETGALPSIPKQKDAGYRVKIKDEAIAPIEPRKISIKSGIVKGSLPTPTSKEDAELDKIASEAKPLQTPKKVVGADSAVAKWQAKRGLEADGIWGKDTQAAYEKEQKSKASVGKPLQGGDIAKAEKEEASSFPAPKSQGARKPSRQPLDRKLTLDDIGLKIESPKKEETKLPSKPSRNLTPNDIGFNTTPKKAEAPKKKATTDNSKEMSQLLPDPSAAKRSAAAEQAKKDASSSKKKAAIAKELSRNERIRKEAKSPLTKLDESIMGDKYMRDADGRLVDKKSKIKLGGAK